ncbi:Fungal specific transcription factor domain containing protein [Rhypophila decipiens]
MGRPRSSFSDKPLLKVSRPVSACSRCRAAKVKCDGKLPACTSCEKAGRENECSAASDQFTRGKERSYVAALESRIETLNRRLEYAKQRKASVALHDQDAVPVAASIAQAPRKDSLAVIRDAVHRKAARKRENSDVNTLISDFGFLSVNATTRDFEPAVTNMTFARLVLAAATNDPLPEPSTTLLPPQKVAHELVQFYLSNIYPLYPIFSDTTLLTLVDDLYTEARRPVRSTDQWLFWMVLALGSSAQSRDVKDDYYKHGVEYVGRALAHADRALQPGYVTQIRSLALLTQYSMLDPAHFDSWHLKGFTSRAAIDLGYHQDPSPIHTVAIDNAALEARRRTFYCVFALDRAISMVHARPFSFYDDAMSVELPLVVRSPPPVFSGGAISGPFSIEASSYLFKLRELQSYWYQNLFQADPSDPLPDPTSFIWQVCLEMRKWSEALPKSLPADILEMLDLELRYSYVYCIAPSPRTPHLTDYGRLLIYEHAISYIERMHDVAHAEKNAAFYTYHDALRVYFMGSQFLAVLRDIPEATLTANPIHVYPYPAPGNPPPPPLPEHGKRMDAIPEPGKRLDDHFQRSVQALLKVTATLGKYGERWEDASSLKTSFETLSSEMVENMRSRIQQNEQRRQQQPQQQEQSRQSQTTQHQWIPQQPQQLQYPQRPQHQQIPQQAMQNAMYHQQGTPLQQVQYPPHPQHQQIPQQAMQNSMYRQQGTPLPQRPQEVSWVDVDVAEMIKRGGQI